MEQIQPGHLHAYWSLHAFKHLQIIHGKPGTCSALHKGQGIEKFLKVSMSSRRVLHWKVITPAIVFHFFDWHDFLKKCVMHTQKMCQRIFIVKLSEKWYNAIQIRLLVPHFFLYVKILHKNLFGFLKNMYTTRLTTLIISRLLSWRLLYFLLFVYMFFSTVIVTFI